MKFGVDKSVGREEIRINIRTLPVSKAYIGRKQTHAQTLQHMCETHLHSRFRQTYN